MTTLPIEQMMNAGGHQVDIATRTIFNDEMEGMAAQGSCLSATS